MCFNLNLLNICLAKSANNNNKNKNNNNNNNSSKKSTSSKKSSNDSICSTANANVNNTNNNVEALDHPNVDSSLGSVINDNANVNNDSSSNSKSKLVLQHPRTLALKHSNNLSQPVNEVECENEETLNSLYLANNISYLVDQDRIVDTPCAHAQALHDSILDLDLCPATATATAVDYRYNDYDDDEFDDYEQQEGHHQYNKINQPLLKFLSSSKPPPGRVPQDYKSISSSSPAQSNPLSTSLSHVYNQQQQQQSFVHPPPRPSQQQNPQASYYKPEANNINNNNNEDNRSFSSESSSSKSSSFSSLVNTSSNQSPYSSVSTLIQQQQQQLQRIGNNNQPLNNLFKPKPIARMFGGGGNTPVSGQDGNPASIAAPNRPSLGGSGGGASPRPGLMGPPPTTDSSAVLNIENLRPKKNVYDFKLDNQNLIAARPNELSRDDEELSSRLDELNNSNNSDESTSRHHQHHHHRIAGPVSGGGGGHHHHHHHHHHHSGGGRYSLDNIKSRGGKITISSSQVYEFKEADFEDLGQIGNGEFGSVHMVRHMPSHTLMAMKRVGPTVGNQGERKKVLKELDFVLECNDYRYVVRFYGVKFNNEPADCLICMELMDTSLEKFYKFVYDVRHEEIPEEILGRVVVAAVNALNYLKEEYQIIHRDVKPSNMLVNRRGEIKMCDFGISGKLVDSIAASRDAGCQLYMAPERIDPTKACANGYDVRSDVWSLGITLYELATGKFPYPQWKTIFHQLKLVVDSDAPRLESERLSPEFKDFVNTCLTKDEKKRPKYKVLLQHPLIQRHSTSEVNVAAYVEPYINEMKSTGFVK